MQDEIASKIASRLTPNPAAPAAERRPTANLAAYDAYLRGQSWDRQALGNYSRVRAVPF